MAEPPPPENRRTLIEAVVASTVGTTIEWYDFFLYGLASALLFDRLFFPQFSAFVGTLLSLLTFSAGFVARPIGGIIFGHFGDRIGRKSTLVTTLLLMGVSTVAVGLLPTSAQIGPSAAILLTLLRFIQGVGVGGEWGGAVLLALEYGHRGKRGFYASWPQAGVPLGLLSATGVLALVQKLLSPDDFMSWGWRIPFLLSGLLIAVGLLIRVRIMETPLFTKLQQSAQVARAPVLEALRDHWREILLAGGARLTENAGFYLFSTYVLTYTKDVLKIDPSVALRAVSIAAGIEFFTIPLFGSLSDYWSRKGIYVLGCLTMIAFAWPYYLLLETRSDLWVTVAIVLSLVLGHAMLYSVQASLIPELFGTRIRYTGASLGYQLAAPIAGLAPPLAVTLVQTFPGQTWPLALLIVGVSIVSLVSVLLLAETSRRDID